MHNWRIKIYAGTDGQRPSKPLCSGVVRANSARQAIVFATEPIVDSDTNITVELEQLPENTETTVEEEFRASWSPRSDGATVKLPWIGEF